MQGAYEFLNENLGSEKTEKNYLEKELNIYKRIIYIYIYIYIYDNNKKNIYMFIYNIKFKKMPAPS